ncbi:MAG: hypothetical protein NTV51_17685 [Verrucomicrobia bacterium]|nr:hypothetical protein [Verrucomicrobiota bacterium]
MKRLLLFLALTVGPLPAQPPATLVKPTVANTITLTAYADNWCAIFINGKLVAVDSIDFLPHNQISVKILPEYPLTIAVLAKDNADPSTGLEYGNQIGDAGFILKLGDGTVTNAKWKAKAFFTGPLNSAIASPQVTRTPLPARWYAPDFDDSAWGFATEYTAARVGPDGDYVAADFTGAAFIWTNDLNLDNTVIFRTTVPAPAGYVKRWNTTPDLDVSQLPAELLPVSTATGTAGQLANLSTRAQVGVDANILIPGFVIGGATARTVLVRAVGPGLVQFGVAGTLADPTLTVFRGSAAIASNDNWQEQANAAAVSTAAVQTGAFALAPGSKDSALVLSLEPGAYTFQVAGAGRTTGVALVEVYVLP